MRIPAAMFVAVMLPSVALGQEQQVKASQLISQGYQIVPFGIALVLQKSNSAYFCEFKFSPNSTVNEKAAVIANASCEQIKYKRERAEGPHEERAP